MAAVREDTGPVTGSIEVVVAPPPRVPAGWWDASLTAYPPAADLELGADGFAVAGWLEPHDRSTRPWRRRSPRWS